MPCSVNFYPVLAYQHCDLEVYDCGGKKRGLGRGQHGEVRSCDADTRGSELDEEVEGETVVGADFMVNGEIMIRMDIGADDG
jgi:hypothetical protein